jgi:superfamily II DNA or RNA helicase
MTVTATTSAFEVGTLVRARGREWVVQPGSSDLLLIVRPLGGGVEDTAGILLGVEPVELAAFPPPTADDLGDDRAARLLRDALRIGFRSSGGPFRSLAGISVSPRPYQLVPLLLALRQDTVRLLIADDVGIGKTVEAGLIAAELLATGAAQRLAVLCPPSLAEQWQAELSSKFGLEAELVLPGSIRRLERGLAQDESVFDRHRVTVVSTDFIKAEHRRNDFLRAAPDLLIVDEAHTVASDDSGKGNSGRTQRYRLMRDLAADPDRHFVLVTATPHSGNDTAFRNLIGLVNPDLRTADLATEAGRILLADHMVQRRRADIRSYLGADTRFPEDRETKELPYRLSVEHRALFDDVLAYVRGQVKDTSGTRLQQRVRWWSALSLLRSMASSPAAAAATLSTRAASVEATDEHRADALGAAEILDQVEDDALDSADATPGALPAEDESASPEARTLRALRNRAQALADATDSDAKLALLVTQVRKLLKDGYHPIVFARFIPTAHYVADHLRDALKSVQVDVVTGELPSEERAARVAALAERTEGQPKVLVATDCLSEGVNLQDAFQAVVHYDLAWNPTRHEQREGRVDRFGQPSPKVRALLLYGEDNGIDGIVLEILLRKHETIRRDLGISVPVPPQSDAVLAALLEGVLLRGKDSDQLELDYGLDTAAIELDEQWRSTAEQEKATRARFAQGRIRPDEVQAAVDAARHSLGEPADIPAFTRTVLTDLRALVTPTAEGFTADVTPVPIGLADALHRPARPVTFVADYPAPRGASVLVRTDPRVTAIGRYTLDAALDPALPDDARPARRCGVVTTNAVAVPTIALLVRFRTHLTLPGRRGTTAHLAEEARALAFTGTPTDPNWLEPGDVEALLACSPSANTPIDLARNMIDGVLTALPLLTSHLDAEAQRIADQLREDHIAVRQAARGERAGALGIRGLEVTPQLPVDVLGVYLYRPSQGSGA